MAGTLTIDTLKASSGVLATQNGMTGIAKAWVFFDGTTSPPTIASSFNVGSITKNGTGDYTINITTAMSSANYSAIVNVSITSGGSGLICNGNSNGVGPSVYITPPTTTTFRMTCTTRSAGSLTDSPYVSVAFFGA